MRVTDYDSISPIDYDVRYRDDRYPGIEAALGSFAASTDGRELLEVGTGTGHWLKFLLDRDARAVGLDLSVTMLRRARQTVPSAPLVQGRADTLPFHDEAFDRVVCVNVLHHFTDKPRFLAEARRVLRSGGGVLSIGLDPHAARDRWWVYEYFPETLGLDRGRYPSTASLRAAMEEAGMTRCATRQVEHIVATETAESARRAGHLDRSFTSQFAILTDQEFERGLQRIEEASEAAAATGAPLQLQSDLHLYATTGWVA